MKLNFIFLKDCKTCCYALQWIEFVQRLLSFVLHQSTDKVVRCYWQGSKKAKFWIHWLMVYLTTAWILHICSGTHQKDQKVGISHQAHLIKSPFPRVQAGHKNYLTNSSATVGAINWLVAHYAVMGINFTHAWNRDLGEGLLSWYQALVMHDTPLQVPHSRNRQLQSMCKLACSCSRSSTCHIATHLSSWSIQVLPNSLPKSPQRGPEVHMMD